MATLGEILQYSYFKSRRMVFIVAANQSQCVLDDSLLIAPKQPPIPTLVRSWVIRFLLGISYFGMKESWWHGRSFPWLPWSDWLFSSHSKSKTQKQYHQSSSVGRVGCSSSSPTTLRTRMAKISSPNSIWISSVNTRNRSLHVTDRVGYVLPA